MIIAALMLQAVQPAPAPSAQPDIQLEVNATARRVVVEHRGRTSLELRTAVNGREGEGNVIDVEAPELPQGRRQLNNVRVRVRAEARIPDPFAPQGPEQPPQQQSEQEPAEPR